MVVGIEVVCYGEETSGSETGMKKQKGMTQRILSGRTLPTLFEQQGVYRAPVLDQAFHLPLNEWSQFVFIICCNILQIVIEGRYLLNTET